MSRNTRQLRELAERKRLLMAKADIQRSSLLLASMPLRKIIRATEIGYMAVQAGRLIRQTEQKNSHEKEESCH